jgi:NAD(P)-dependent dehydrogenase (short-subunit alcohol dehydrogenase family)
MPESQGLLEGKITLITGAGSGMGRASALKFAAAGAHVVIVDRDLGAAQAAADAVGLTGGSAEAYELDVSDLDATRRMVETVGEQHGRLDVLFNHVGAACPPGMAVTEADWERAIAVNLRAPVFITQHALPLLKSAPNGASIIFTASIAGLVASPLSPVYSAAKGGVVQYARALSVALGGDGIRVNTICPGPTETSMLLDFFAPTVGGAEVTRDAIAPGVDRFIERVPLGRVGQPGDVADLALFLASDASSYITGVAIPVDGGYVAA